MAYFGCFLVLHKPLFLHCLLVIVFCFGYGLLSFEFFVLRRHDQVGDRNTKKSQEFSECVNNGRNYTTMT